MTKYANTLNETFVEVSKQLDEKGFKFYKKLLKVIDKNLVDFPLCNLSSEDLVKEVENNMWFFIRELLLTEPEDEEQFTWKTFLTLDLLNSKKSALIVNDDNAMSLAMYLEWLTHTGNETIVVIPEKDGRANVMGRISKVKLDETFEKLIPRNDKWSYTSYASFDVSNDEHVIIYAPELTNELLSFFFLNKDKTQITVIVGKDDLLFKTNRRLIPKLQSKFEDEFQFFDPTYLHRHLMSNFSLYADLSEW